MLLKQQPPLEQCLPDLRDWFDSDLGQQLLSAEQILLDRLLPTLFGYHLVQISIDSRLDLGRESPIKHRMRVSPVAELGMSEHTLIAKNEELPLEHNSCDVVILHHALDFAQSPHQVLREAARILRPGGHLILLGFNPVSSWGLYRALRWHKNELPWSGHFISQHRLRDWLVLLELTEVRALSGYFALPFQRTKWRENSFFCERILRRYGKRNGAFSIQVARKDVAGIMAIKPRWQRRRLINLPIAEPTARANKIGR